MDVKNRNLLNYFCVIILICSQGAIASENDYLSLLEAEAESSRLDLAESSGGSVKWNRVQHVFAKNLENKDWSGECGVIGKALPSNIQQGNFFSYLEKCSMTTFSLYRKLDSDLQLSIYKDYSSRASMKVSALRKEVLKIYKFRNGG